MAGSLRCVIRAELYRSSRPGYPGEAVLLEMVEEWLHEVREVGVKSIICLLSVDQLGFYDGLPGGLLECYRRHGLDVVHVPITDPADDPTRGCRELEENLDYICDSFEQLAKPVLVHCSAGKDRTGAAVRHIEQRLRSEGKGSAE
ncbi:MAG: tyrosine-protein phosphatase [Armatimonadota bacterium]|jgi:protein-tyrosine phosphatase